MGYRPDIMKFRQIEFRTEKKDFSQKEIHLIWNRILTLTPRIAVGTVFILLPIKKSFHCRREMEDAPLNCLTDILFLIVPLIFVLRTVYVRYFVKLEIISKWFVNYNFKG